VAARCILIALAMSALFPVATTAQGHPTPPPEIVKELRHHRGDRLRITTDSVRYEARVGEIDDVGLAGLTSARKSAPAPERIAWSSIARIDVMKSHALRGRITFGLLGLCAGFIPLANGNDNTSQPGYYMLGGAMLGSYLGGKLGERNMREVALYVAPLPPPSAVPVATLPESARTETLKVTQPSPSPLVASPRPSASASSPITSSAAIDRACRRISSQDLLRIEGAFGTFHGYASSIGPEGLSGLRAESHYASVPSPGSVPWDRIERLHIRSGNAGKGALRGALSVGVGIGLLSIPLGAVVSDNSDTSMWEVVFACAGVGAGIGGLIGAGIGASTSSWQRVDLGR